jgi:hypothetical protein
MDVTLIIAIAALALGLVAAAVSALTWRQVRALGLGLGPRAGPLPGRLETIGRRLGALEAGQAALDQALGRAGLRPAVVHYAPLGLAGARNCFVLALLNREGDGVVLNYLAGTGVRVDLKEVRAWASQGLALTAEEEQAVARARAEWASAA